MKRADASGAVLAAIIGDEEEAAKQVTLKMLREVSEQKRVAFDQLAETVGELIFEWDDENGGI